MKFVSNDILLRLFGVLFSILISSVFFLLLIKKLTNTHIILIKTKTVYTSNFSRHFTYEITHSIISHQYKRYQLIQMDVKWIIYFVFLDNFKFFAFLNKMNFFFYVFYGKCENDRMRWLKRRRYVWQMLAVDWFICLTLGRPNVKSMYTQCCGFAARYFSRYCVLVWEAVASDTEYFLSSWKYRQFLFIRAYLLRRFKNG